MRAKLRRTPTLGIGPSLSGPWIITLAARDVLHCRRHPVDRGERCDERDLVVVGDLGELVGRHQAPGQERGALAGDLDPGPGH